MARYHKTAPDPLVDAFGPVLRSAGLEDEFRWRWRLQRLWAYIAGEPLASASWVLAYRDGILTVAVTDAGFATQLRFAQRQLVEQLRGRGLHDLTRIEHRVRPQAAPPAQRGRQYSTEAADQIAHIAASEIADDDLRSSLFRLARHVLPPDQRSPAS